MKNKLNKILLIVSFSIVILTLLLAILGSGNKIGYLSEFKLNKDLSKRNAYNYDFRIKYYSSIFRNSDIYDVVFDVPQFAYVGKNLIEFKNITFDKKGSSPFGNFISTRELRYDDKIQSINYKLKLKPYIIIIALLAFIYILFNYKFISNIFKDRKELITKISKVSSISILALFVLLFILGKLNHKASLEDLELVAESEAGYVYRARVVGKGLFADNVIYKYNSKLQLKNKPDYIKNYGYNLNLKLKNHKSKNGSIYNNPDKTVTISNDNNYYSVLVYDIEPSVGEKYIFTLEAKKIGDVSGNIKYQLDDINYDIVVPNTDKMTDEYKEYISTLNIKDAKKSVKPVMRVFYPLGTINVKSLNIKQVSDNLYLKSGNSIIFTSSKKIIDSEKINNIYYNLNIRPSFILLAILLMIIIFFNYIYSKFVIINEKDSNFIILALLIAAILYIFQYWMFFPGFWYNIDIIIPMLQGVENEYTNSNPFIIGVTLHLLYRLFGYNISYIFILNLTLWYLSLLIIILSLYFKYKKYNVLLIYLINLLHVIFIMNITHLRDATSTLFVFFSCSLILLLILHYNKLNNIFKLVISFTSIFFLVISMFWRHNFIVTIYPILIIFIFLQNIKLNKLKIILSMIIIASLLIILYQFVPMLFIEKDDNTRTRLTYHIYYLQIVGMSHYSKDPSMIPNDWYFDNKSYSDAEREYKKNPHHADILASIFSKEKTKNVKSIWIKYIFKHPIAYLKHIIPYTIKMWTVTSWKYNSQKIQLKKDVSSIPTRLNEIEQKKMLVFGDTKLIFNEVKKFIYDYFIYRCLIDISVIYFIILSFFIFILSFVILIINKNYNTLLVFSFFTSFSATSTAVIVALFTPIIHTRYIYPVIPITIISLIGFITFIYDKGGLKKIIKDLKGNNK